MLLARMTSKDTAEYLRKDDRLVLPVGSTEQHGTRGVVGTDFMIAEKIAEAVADEVGVICAPCVTYGMSEHHMAFSGSLSVQPAPLTQFYASLLRSACEAGFRRILVVNGHGGNTACLIPAGTQAAESCPELLFKLAEWYQHPKVKAIIQEEFGDADGLHGTASELSIVQYLFEGLIGSEPQPPQPTLPFDVLLTRAVMRTRYPDGSINTDQNLANADAGKRLFDASVEVFAEELRTWP